MHDTHSSYIEEASSELLDGRVSQIASEAFLGHWKETWYSKSTSSCKRDLEANNAPSTREGQDLPIEGSLRIGDPGQWKLCDAVSLWTKSS